MHDRRRQLAKAAQQAAHLGQDRRRAGDLERAAVEHVALRVDRDQRGGGEIGAGVGILVHVLYKAWP